MKINNLLVIVLVIVACFIGCEGVKVFSPSNFKIFERFRDNTIREYLGDTVAIIKGDNIYRVDTVKTSFYTKGVDSTIYVDKIVYIDGEVDTNLIKQRYETIIQAYEASVGERDSTIRALKATYVYIDTIVGADVEIVVVDTVTNNRLVLPRTTTITNNRECYKPKTVFMYGAGAGVFFGKSPLIDLNIGVNVKQKYTIRVDIVTNGSTNGGFISLSKKF